MDHWKINTKSLLLRELLNSQSQQSYQYFLQNDYHQASILYQQAIETEPTVTWNYWYLGLTYTLQGNEAEAQATWLSVMLEAEPEEVEAWTAELVQVLTTEANRRESLKDFQVAWVIRQHIREIVPDNLENILCLIQRFVDLEIVEDLDVALSGAIELINRENIPNNELCANTLQKILDFAPTLPLSVEFTKACVKKFYGDLENLVINKIANLVQKRKIAKLQATQYLEICHQIQPESIPILINLVNLYQDTQKYEQGSILTETLLQRSPTLTNTIAGYYLKIRGLLKSGGNFADAWDSHKKYENLLTELIDLAKTQEVELETDHLFNLISTISFFNYLEDSPDRANLFRQSFSRFWQLEIDRYFSSIQFDFTERYRAISQERRTLRIGYISGCLTRHSVGSICRWLMQYSDRTQFQTYAYSLKRTDDEIQQSIARSVSVFHDLSQGQTIPEIAELIYQDEIDILVDLDSLTSSTACAVMALKPAPIQVTWLGFDASEIPAIDYFIADPYVLPETAQDYYSETIWRLPQTYIAVDGFEVGVPTLRREQLEIPSDAVVYFSSQTGAKRHPDNVRLQMRILKDVPNSYFLVKGLYTDVESVKRFFEEIAEEEGVDFDRLRFLPDVPSEAVHRANLGIADIVLDTYPYNGTTTTLETLWMGVPVVTRVGQQFASRQGYTLLMNVGVTEGISWTDEEYVEWGVRLGNDAALRQEVAWKLRMSRHHAPLWNSQKFTRDLEEAYTQMWEIYIRGQE